MRNRSSANPMLFRLAFPALILTAAYGQPGGEKMLDRVFQLTYIETRQQFQEVATAVRMFAIPREVSADPEQKSLTVSGTTDQIALAQWLISELDQPASVGQPGTPVEMSEYRLPGSNADLVRVVHVNYAQIPRDLQEIATLLRTDAGIQLVYTFGAKRALAFRGSADEVELGQWIIDELGKPAGAQNHAAREYRSVQGGDEVAQISYLKHAETLQQLAELNTMLRAVAHVRRIFTYASKNALVMRGSPEEMALSRWLVDELDQAGAGASGAQTGARPPAAEYRMPGSGGEVVRVIYLGQTETVKDLQQFATIVRQKTAIRELFTYSGSKALVFRGRADQVGLAESVVQPAGKR